MADVQDNELGDFLRSRRAQLNPKAVGLPVSGRRRTEGLRREEVAQLAGIGVDWYIRLEQGRAVSASTTTIDALARALRLSKIEHAHMRALSARSARRPFEREIVPETIRRVIEGLNKPAYVTGRRWDVLFWNVAADEIFAFSRMADADRNTLVSMLTNPRSKGLFGEGWEAEARRMVAQFRATHDLWAGDLAFRELRDRLSADCPEFDGWWNTHEIRNATAGFKRLSHPTKGALEFEYVTFQANDDPALKLAIYSVL